VRGLEGHVIPPTQSLTPLGIVHYLLQSQIFLPSVCYLRDNRCLDLTWYSSKVLTHHLALGS